MNEAKTSADISAETVPTMEDKFADALSELIGMCHDAGMPASEFIPELESWLRWARANR
jgi:hypothetical protein